MAADAGRASRAGAIDLLTFATPAWLAGLVLLPMIRWIHRGGAHRRAMPVSFLALWRSTVATRPAPGERQPPDPAWRRRAVLAALLFLALAGPRLVEERTVVTLWVDDSLSMLTREEHGTRLAEGLARARTLGAELPGAEVEVRALSDPWRSRGAFTEATVAALAARAGRAEPSAPPAALLRPDRLHWLVTDGADAVVFAWPGDRHPDRTIQVATVTRNVGLERISARRSLDDPDRYDLMLKVTNGGAAVETREVVFATETGEIARSVQRLEPGTSALVTASMHAAPRLRAFLQPADALTEDDEIVLDLGVLRRHPVTVDASCPRALLGAIRTHPALIVRNEGAAEVAIDCGASRGGGDAGTLHVRMERTPVALQGVAQWDSSVPGSMRVALDGDVLRTAARLQASRSDTVLLAIGGEPVIVRRSGAANVVETSIDFTSADSARLWQTPLLVDFMFQNLLGRPLLDDIAGVDRGVRSTVVLPIGPARENGPARPITSSAAKDWTPMVLAVALLVLLWEIVSLARQWHRLRDYAGVESG